jgi:hypothetical protein
MGTKTSEFKTYSEYAEKLPQKCMQKVKNKIKYWTIKFLICITVFKNYWPINYFGDVFWIF